MLIKERPKKPGMKELKVNIPVKYHLQLHGLKVMEGKQIHGVVQEALDNYFSMLKVAREEREEEDEDRPLRDARR